VQQRLRFKTRWKYLILSWWSNYCLLFFSSEWAWDASLPEIDCLRAKESISRMSPCSSACYST
jgi:hypothetical protein